MNDTQIKQLLDALNVIAADYEALRGGTCPLGVKQAAATIKALAASFTPAGGGGRTPASVTPIGK